MFGMRRSGLWVRGAAAVLVAVAAAGCGGSSASSVRDDATATSAAASASESRGTYEYQLRSFGDGRVSFSFRLGPGEQISPRASDPTTPSSATDPLKLKLTRKGDVVADITAYAADSPLTYPNTSLGNGRTGVYRTTADIPAEEAAAATHVQTVLGDATVFTHPYFECTNSCKKWTVPVAVITLTDPTDPRFPTLVFASNHGELDANGLRDLLSRLAR